MRFGSGYGRCDDDLAQRSDRLWPAGDHLYAPKRGNVFVALVGGFDNAKQGSRSNAGQEYDHVEFSGEESPSESQGLCVGFQANFAHRRRNNGLPAVGGNQFSEFLSAAAFQREYS